MLHNKRKALAIHTESECQDSLGKKTTKTNVNWNMLGHEIFILHHKKRMRSSKGEKKKEYNRTRAFTALLCFCYLLYLWVSFFFLSGQPHGSCDKLNKVKLFCSHSLLNWLLLLFERRQKGINFKLLSIPNPPTSTME